MRSIEMTVGIVLILIAILEMVVIMRTVQSATPGLTLAVIHE